MKPMWLVGRVLLVALMLFAAGCGGSAAVETETAEPPDSPEPDEPTSEPAPATTTPDVPAGQDLPTTPEATPAPQTTPEPTVAPEPTAAPEPTVAPEPTTPADETATPLPATSFEPVTDDATVLAAEACQIPEAAHHGGVGVGWPRYTPRLPTSGVVNATVLFADFDDAPANRDPSEVFDIVSPGGELFLSEMSYGGFEVQLTPHFEWLRMSEPTAFYADAIITFEGHRDNLQEAIDLADDAVDFSGTDLVVVINNPDAETIAYGPTFLGHWGDDGYLIADGHQIANGITSGHDLLHWGFLWLPHEMGHSLGLADLYSYEGLPGFTGRFSMMNDIGQIAPEWLAWERWQLGWVTDDQIVCVGSGTAAMFIEAIELASDRTKAVIVPAGETRAVVVESRRAIGFDSPIGGDEGVIVYVVDSSIPTGYGPIEVMNGQRELRAGESATVEGVTVEVLANNHDGDIVWVSVAE